MAYQASAPCPEKERFHVIGFFAIGVYHPKHHQNIGTLLRSAYGFGCSMVSTAGQRFTKQSSDTEGAWTKMPVMNFSDIDDLVAHLPYSCPLIGVELSEKSAPLNCFTHPFRAAYLLGAEDHGLPKSVIDKCHGLVSIPGSSRCLNVAVAGSIVMYDRIEKSASKN